MSDVGNRTSQLVPAVDVLAAQVRDAIVELYGGGDVRFTHAADEAKQAAFESLAALVARVTEAERERDELQAVIGHPRSLHSQLADARNALERIAQNAESWHGPPPDNGHVRALGVIAGWARGVLVRLDGNQP